MNANRIRPTDNVLVEIYLDGKKVDTYEGSGYPLQMFASFSDRTE